MSTASTALMGASSTILRDFYQRFIRPEATSKELVLPSRIAVLAAGALTSVLAIFYPGGAAWLLAAAGAWFGTPAVLLVLSIYWKRITPTGRLLGDDHGAGRDHRLAARPLLAKRRPHGLRALAVTLTGTILVSLATQSENLRKTGSFTIADRHLRILALLRNGRNTLDAVVDNLEIDGEQAYRTLNELISAGLIRRAGEAGTPSSPSC